MLGARLGWCVCAGAPSAGSSPAVFTSGAGLSSRQTPGLWKRQNSAGHNQGRGHGAVGSADLGWHGGAAATLGLLHARQPPAVDWAHERGSHSLWFTGVSPGSGAVPCTGFVLRKPLLNGQSPEPGAGGTTVTTSLYPEDLALSWGDPQQTGDHTAYVRGYLS